MENGSQVIFKDVLNFLEIKNIVFDFENGKTSSLQIERISEKEFICFSSSTLVPLGTLIIETDSGFFPIKCLTQSLSYSYYIGEYRIEFLEALPKFLIKKIRKYNALIKKSNRRSEERYDVGLKKWQDFLLERADQRLIISKTENIRCILTNVSFHGALLTGESSRLKVNESVVYLAMRFTSPMETIIQPAVICRIENRTKELSRYSLKFIEPYSLSWQKRIEAFGER